MGPDVRTSGHTYLSCIFCNTLTDCYYGHKMNWSGDMAAICENQGVFSYHSRTTPVKGNYHPHCIWMDSNYSWVYAYRTVANDTFVKQIPHQGFGIHLDDVFGSKGRPDQYSPPRNATTNATIELPETMPHNPNSATAPWVPYLNVNHVNYCNNPGRFLLSKRSAVLRQEMTVQC